MQALTRCLGDAACSQMKTFWASPMGQLVLTSRVSGGESLREARAAMRAAERKMGGRKKGGIGPGPSTH